MTTTITIQRDGQEIEIDIEGELLKPAPEIGVYEPEWQIDAFGYELTPAEECEAIRALERERDSLVNIGDRDPFVHF